MPTEASNIDTNETVFSSTNGYGFAKFYETWNQYYSTFQTCEPYLSTVSFNIIEKPYKPINIIKTIHNIKHEFGIHDNIMSMLNCSRIELSDLELGLAKKSILLRMKLVCLIHNIECFIFDQSERMTLQVGLDGRDCLLERICDELLKGEGK